LQEIGKSYEPRLSGRPRKPAWEAGTRCACPSEGNDASGQQQGSQAMSISLILLIVLILLLVGALPSWPYSSGWGYWPSGGVGLVVLVLIILLLLGRI
jgi:Protein of unknown function (DUF3309)